MLSRSNLDLKWLGALCLSLCCLGSATARTGVSERRALLIGVNQYDEGCDRAPARAACHSNNLLGPTHDVQSLQATLEQFWGFRSQDITTLVDSNAKRANILAALRELESWAGPGKLAVIYFSGHGTSPQNADNFANLPAADTGALVVAPEDLSHPRASFLVGRTDIRPVLERMDAKGAEVFAAFDACFSQNTARSAQSRVRAYKDLSLGAQRPTDFTAARAAQTPGGSEDSPYHHIFYLSAAGAAEPALDIESDRTYDAQPHGAFTDALIRVLTHRAPHAESQRGVLTYDELADAVEDFMRPRGYGHTPVRMPGRYAAERAVAEHPVFGVHDSRAQETPVQNAAGIRVRLDATANFLQPSLQHIPGLDLAVARDTNVEYIIRDPYNDGGHRIVITTPGNEPIYGAGGLDRAYPQDAPGVLKSFALRASLRKLFVTTQGQRGGLTLQAGFTDPTLGETVTAATPVSLFAQSSARAQVLVLHLMGDGSTHVWVSAASHDPECPGGMDLPEARSRILCQWGGAVPPYGLDLLYVVAFAPTIPKPLAAPGSTFDTDFVTRLTATAAATPRGIAVRELRFYTVPRKYQ